MEREIVDKEKLAELLSKKKVLEDKLHNIHVHFHHKDFSLVNDKGFKIDFTVFTAKDVLKGIEAELIKKINELDKDILHLK